ncbi:MAG: hypothetical protein ACLQVJ_15480 [Syntrophobacteraceae bacterium]
MRAIAGKKPGVLPLVGLGTFVDAGDKGGGLKGTQTKAVAVK